MKTETQIAKQVWARKPKGGKEMKRRIEISLIGIVFMWLFNIMWFWFSNEVPSRVEALILLNLIIISVIILLNYDLEKEKE